MARTAADNLAQYKYNKEHIKRIPLDVQKTEYERIKAAAVAAGLPVNTWIKNAIRAALGDGDASGAGEDPAAAGPVDPEN